MTTNPTPVDPAVDLFSCEDCGRTSEDVLIREHRMAWTILCPECWSTR